MRRQIIAVDSECNNSRPLGKKARVKQVLQEVERYMLASDGQEITETIMTALEKARAAAERKAVANRNARVAACSTLSSGSRSLVSLDDKRSRTRKRSRSGHADVT